MRDEIESYKLGDVRVKVSETDDPGRVHIDCNDDNYHSSFIVSKYEYKYYKRHLNQKITLAYKKASGDKEA